MAGDWLFRIGSFARYLLRSGNTLGYGIHSPHLFTIARVIVPEQAQYYCFSEIEAVRQELVRRRDAIRVVDYGTGSLIRSKGERTQTTIKADSGDKAVSYSSVSKADTSPTLGEELRRVSREELRVVGEVARRSLMSREEAQMLFRLVNYEEAQMIVELGTCLGVTTAYLAKPRREAEVWTFEGSEALLEIAKSNWKRLGINNIHAVPGNIDETLETTVAGWEKPVDFALIDANHCYDATVRYFDVLAKKATEKSVFAVDDIRRDKEMWRAWEAIGKREDVTARMDLGQMGLVFFDKHLPKEVFTLRV